MSDGFFCGRAALIRSMCLDIGLFFISDLLRVLALSAPNSLSSPILPRFNLSFHSVLFRFFVVVAVIGE